MKVIRLFLVPAQKSNKVALAYAGNEIILRGRTEEESQQLHTLERFAIGFVPGVAPHRQAPFSISPFTINDFRAIVAGCGSRPNLSGVR